MDLGDKIKAARTTKGLTQKELAHETGLTERTIQRIENHEVEPSLYSLNKISTVLQFDFSLEKEKIMNKRKRIVYSVMLLWTAALVYNVFFTSFNFSARWWEILLWFMTLIFVITGQIYIPYRRKRAS